MRYRTRHAERKLKLLAQHFKAVLVTGARQVGTSTLLSHVFPDVKQVVFDPVQDVYQARSDPDLFLDSFPPPAILDEIQFAPELLSALKRRVDRSEAPGQYFLSGSQNLAVLRSVSESMAGRVGILHLEGMTLDEMLGHGAESGWLEHYLTQPDSLCERSVGIRREAGSLTRCLWRGGLPGLLDAPDELVPDFFTSYVQTYVERDVRRMEDVRELADFGRLIGLAGALTGQEINATKLGRDIGVSRNTARHWLDLLTYTYQWREVFPYHGSAVKRIAKRRKGYLSDTGLACWLQRVSSPEALAASPLLGAMFETWVANAVHRQFVTLDGRRRRGGHRAGARRQALSDRGEVQDPPQRPRHPRPPGLPRDLRPRARDARPHRLRGRGVLSRQPPHHCSALERGRVLSPSRVRAAQQELRPPSAVSPATGDRCLAHGVSRGIPAYPCKPRQGRKRRVTAPARRSSGALYHP